MQFKTGKQEEQERGNATQCKTLQLLATRKGQPEGRKGGRKRAPPLYFFFQELFFKAGRSNKRTLHSKTPRHILDTKPPAQRILFFRVRNSSAELRVNCSLFFSFSSWGGPSMQQKKKVLLYFNSNHKHQQSCQKGNRNDKTRSARRTRCLVPRARCCCCCSCSLACACEPVGR